MRRRRSVHIVDLPPTALLADVRKELCRSGLSLEQFIELGRSEELDDQRLRDLWLMAGPAIESARLAVTRKRAGEVFVDTLRDLGAPDDILATAERVANEQQ